MQRSYPTYNDFNSRTPRGMRLILLCYNNYATNFNSRTPRGMRPVPVVSPAR